MNSSTNTSHIVLGVCGGIAAYKSCFLVRLLKKRAYRVTVVLTPEAEKFVSSKTFQALSGEPVLTQANVYTLKEGMEHIHLTRQADLLVIAPASANTLAKLANGIADNFLTELAAARNIPLLVAPAMNVRMWYNPANQRNIQRLQADGVMLLGPETGIQACGENGIGRMLEPEILADLISGQLFPPLLKDKKVLMTAGATREMLDPVRCLTNLSSGKMGIELARACRNAGAEVTLIHGQLEVPIPYGLSKVRYALSAKEMYAAVHEEVEDQDIFISVAAVADYRVKHPAQTKIKKSTETVNEPLKLELETNPDILASVAALDDEPFCVGFAAESECLLEYAQQKRLRKKIPLLVANQVDQSLGKELSTAYLIGDKGITNLQQQPKSIIAQEIVRTIAEYLS
ncbi:MAG: bifunctional phosphopantothenoylcysteine decarboxylase/phosphopantothenate--cysteine ligase CoaBC [Neisseriaceae bacterium]